MPDVQHNSHRCRVCRPTDIPVCAEIEAASYPADEAASKSSLQYRQHHAARYFLCAVTGNGDMYDHNNDHDDQEDTVIGFVCGTKCHAFTHESMSVHEPTGQLLAIHSVVVAEAYRKQGIATRLLQEYIQRVINSNPEDRPAKIVLLSKANLLAFYVKCGFRVMRPSAISHGREQWYDLELDVAQSDDSAQQHAWFIVDAFADPSSAGTGNPAAVVSLSSEPSVDQVQWMQTVAQEFNLSETAFVWKKDIQDDGNGASGNEVHYGIRYFTPSVEVALCGHATLASAGVLFQTATDIPAGIVFHAPKDVLRASKSASTSSDGQRCTRVAMTFPAKPATELGSDEKRLAVRAMLRASLNIDESDIIYIGLSEGLGDLLIEVTHSAIRGIGCDQQLNLSALLEWDGYTRGVIVCSVEVPPTAQQDVEREVSPSAPVDFCSRFFGPKAGIAEDPVTGSAHCALAPYFGFKLGKQLVVGRQMSLRGGIVECELAEDSLSVKLTGTAVTTLSGTLWI